MQPPKADVTIVTRLRLPAEATSPARARRALRETISSRVTPEVLEDALLIVSELVANAMMHAGLREGDEIDFCVRADGHVRIVVRDRGCGFMHPGAREAASRRFGGRGLGIVASVSDRWGIVEDDGVLVWAELALVREAENGPPG